jgi:thiol-disulfide isomerase/thioredoxin
MILRATFLLVVMAATTAFADQPVKPIAIGDKVPDFTVTSLDGKQHKLSDLQKNKKLTTSGVTVFTFWCSFCHSCRHVEKPVDQLAAQYKGKVSVVAIDSSFGETAKAVASFKNEKQLTMPIALDPKGQVADLFGATKTTTTVVIDGEGKLRYFGQFAHGREALAKQAIQALVAGREVRTSHTHQRG